MLVIPILYKGKIYHVEMRLKKTYEISNFSSYDGHYESDIIINGCSYNQSSYYTKNAPLNSVTQFIRTHSVYAPTDSYLLTSKKNDQGQMRVYRVALPHSYVTEGLDSLYSSVILNMKRDIPNHFKDRNISLKKLKVLDHVTKENLKIAREKMISQDENSHKVEDDPILKNYQQTLDFLDQFECRVIDGAVMDEKMLLGVIQAVQPFHTDSSKEFKNYYQIAKENSYEYRKAECLSRVMTGNSLQWISEEKDMMKVKNWNETHGKSVA